MEELWREQRLGCHFRWQWRWRSLSQDGRGGTGQSQGASSRGFAYFLHLDW